MVLEISGGAVMFDFDARYLLSGLCKNYIVLYGVNVKFLLLLN